MLGKVRGAVFSDGFDLTGGQLSASVGSLEDLDPNNNTAQGDQNN